MNYQQCAASVFIFQSREMLAKFPGKTDVMKTDRVVCVSLQNKSWDVQFYYLQSKDFMCSGLIQKQKLDVLRDTQIYIKKTIGETRRGGKLSLFYVQDDCLYVGLLGNSTFCQ